MGARRVNPCRRPTPPTRGTWPGVGLADVAHLVVELLEGEDPAGDPGSGGGGGGGLQGGTAVAGGRGSTSRGVEAGGGV